MLLYFYMQVGNFQLGETPGQTPARYLPKSAQTPGQRSATPTTRPCANATTLSLHKAKRELPKPAERLTGQRGRVAKADAENLHEAFVKYETEVSRFARNPAVGIDKLTEISLFWLRFVLAHKIQLVDYHGYLFFNRV